MQQRRFLDVYHEPADVRAGDELPDAGPAVAGEGTSLFP